MSNNARLDRFCDKYEKCYEIFKDFSQATGTHDDRSEYTRIYDNVTSALKSAYASNGYVRDAVNDRIKADCERLDAIQERYRGVIKDMLQQTFQADTAPYHGRGLKNANGWRDGWISCLESQYSEVYKFCMTCLASPFPPADTGVCESFVERYEGLYGVLKSLPDEVHPYFIEMLDARINKDMERLERLANMHIQTAQYGQENP